jgi:thiol-disulfide isomerase/thioredoxin
LAWKLCFPLFAFETFLISPLFYVLIVDNFSTKIRVYLKISAINTIQQMELDLNNDDSSQIDTFKGREGQWVVFAHATWCPHCTDMISTWDSFSSEIIKKYSHLNTAKVEYALLQKEGTLLSPEVVGFPTVRFYDGQTSTAEHEGARDVQGLTDFVEKHIQSGGGGGESRKRRSKKGGKGPPDNNQHRSRQSRRRGGNRLRRSRRSRRSRRR